MKIKLDDNTEISIIKRFENNNINYIIYTDEEVDETNQLLIHASRYSIKEDNYVLEAIENEKEWDMIDQVLKEMRSRI